MKIESNSATIKSAVNQASNAVQRSIEGIDELTPEQKNMVNEAIKNTEVPVIEVPNTLVYWIAVSAIAIFVVVIVIGSLLLAADKITIPNFLQTALATGIGALAGMIVPSPKAGV